MAATEKVGIEIELTNADTALKTLQNIDNTVRDLGRKKTMIKLDDGSLVSIDERITEIQNKLVALRSSGDKEIIDHGSVKNAKELNGELKVLQRGLKTATANSKTFMQTLNGIASKAAHMGSAMQSLGNSLTRLTSPFRRLTTGFVMGAGYKALNAVTEGVESGFSRYDTVKTYERMMETYSDANYDVVQSRKDLVASVKGLPTGLDEMMSLAQRYTLSLGDMEKGTKLAIATNNAFLASMSTESQRYQGMMQMQDLLNGKDLNSREWMSLGSAMGKAINEIGKEFGYTDENMGEFRKELYAGNIATKDFLNALEKVGTGEGSIAQMASLSKQTWDAVTSNVRNAFSRMGDGILETADEIIKEYTKGEFANLPSFLATQLDKVDNITASIQNWMRGHKDEIIDFFKGLAEIDWAGLLRGMAQGVGWLAKLVKGFAEFAGDKNLERLGKWGVKGNVWGWIFSTFGGFLKGTRHIWGFLGAGVMKGIGKLGKGGLFGRIASLFGSKKAVETAGEVGGAITKASPKLISGIKNMALVCGTLALPAITGFVITEATKRGIANFKETISLLKDIEWNDAKKLLAGIGGFLGGSAIVGGLVGKFGVEAGTFAVIGETIIGVASAIALGFADLDMVFIKDGLTKLRDSLLLFDEIGSAITNMKGLVGINTGKGSKIADSVQAIRDIHTALVGKNGGPADRGEYSLGLPIVTPDFANSLTNIANALTKMQDVVAQFNIVSELTVNDPSEVMGDIKAACDQLQGIRGPKNIVEHTTAVADALKQIRTMAKRINSLAGISVDVGGFGAFVQQIKDALDGLKSLDQVMTLDIKVVLGDGFRTSVNGVEKQIKDARSTIQKAVNYVANHTYRATVNVTISARVNTAGAISAIQQGVDAVQRGAQGGLKNTPQEQAMGGLIYRARGGSVFKPRGTDTVPAMLTPGEFVHNKRAVSTFGIDFMRKVNALDVKGAMNELMHRAGNMANVNRGMTVTNNYNNNQKVVINNNGASGADFTFKRASRFVGAF